MNRKKLVVFCFVTLLYISTGANAMTSPNIHHFTLENGLNVALVKDELSPIVSARTYIRAGSIDEGALLGSGASHYLEHLVAGGTTSKRSEDEYKRSIALLGGAFNAYTTVDHTCYYINTTENLTNEAIDMLYEWMFYNTLEEKECDRERKVIQKEIEKNNAHIGRKFYQQSQKNFYKTHPLQFPVIGYLDAFNSITRESLNEYYKKFYVPSNMFLIIAGNIEIEETMSYIEKTFGTEPSLPKPIREIFNEPLPFSPRVSLEFDTTNVTSISMRFPTVDLYSPFLYPLDLLDYILGNGDDSILNKVIVEEKKLAYSINVSSYTPDFTSGYFDISAEIDSKNKDRFEEEIFAVLSNIKNGKISKKDIEKAKKQKIAEQILDITSAEDKASSIGQSLLYGYTTTFFDNYAENFKQLTKKDLVRTATQFLDKNKCIITIQQPKNETEQLSEKTSSISPLSTKKITLDNGLKIIMIQDNSAKKVFIQSMIMGGIRKENKNNNGIGHMMMEMLGKESKNFSKQKIRDLIEGNGAELGAGMGNNTFYVHMYSLSEDFNALLPIFFDVWLTPVFSVDEYSETKRQTLKEIEQIPDDWYTFGITTFKAAFFGNHPYGLPHIGRKESIENISINDIQQYHDHLINPNNTVITVVGNFDEKTTVNIIKKNMEKLNKKNKKNRPIDRSFHTKETENKIEIPQEVAAIFIGFDGTSFSEPNESIRLDLVDSVLSGMRYPGGRLHSLLREKGLVYMVHGSNQEGIENGTFYIVALSSKDSIKEVTSIIFEQIDAIKNSPVSDNEFEEAIAQLTFHSKDKISTRESLSTLMATDELYGRGYLFYQKNKEKINELSKEDVMKYAKKYLVNPQIYIFENK
jgi:zinc protease